MPLDAVTLLVAPGASVTLTALKESGVSVTDGSFVAATTVRVTAGGVCAAAAPARPTTPTSSIPAVEYCMMASRAPGEHTQFRRDGICGLLRQLKKRAGRNSASSTRGRLRTSSSATAAPMNGDIVTALCVTAR